MLNKSLDMAALDGIIPAARGVTSRVPKNHHRAPGQQPGVYSGSAMSFTFTPRQMRASQAAHYCSVSESTFLERVRTGAYPPGAKDGSARVWLRDDLDRMIEKRFGVSEDESSRTNDNEFMERFGDAS